MNLLLIDVTQKQHYIFSPASKAGGNAFELPCRLRVSESMPTKASLVLTVRRTWITGGGGRREVHDIFCYNVSSYRQ